MTALTPLERLACGEPANAPEDDAATPGRG